MKTNVYVDGFNLYYGCLKGTPFRWLDLGKLCRVTLKGYDINHIRYFTARVQSRAGRSSQTQKQQAYIRALHTVPGLSVHFGHFLSNTVRMPLAKPQEGGQKFADVIKTEEKGSDVNIATHLLLDGFKGDYEAAVVISNDSDLVEPIKVVRRELGLDVGVLNPHKNVSWALKNNATFYRQLRQGPPRASQFPAKLTDSKGEISKPDNW